MILPHEEGEVRSCLRYLATHLRGPRSSDWTDKDETFYLMGLRGCTLQALKATFRAGIGKWRYMPKPADILELYQDIAGAPTYTPGTSSAGCPECDGTGWQHVGVRTVSPCSCAKGRSRRARRNGHQPA